MMERDCVVNPRPAGDLSHLRHGGDMGKQVGPKRLLVSLFNMGD